MSQRPLVTLAQATAGLTLFATIALPFTTRGQSLLDIILEMLAQNPMAALVFLCMFGAPQLFGLAIAGAHFMREEKSAVGLVQLPLAIVQSMIFLLGFSLISAPRPIAAIGYIGFAFVSSGYYLYASGEAAASSRQGLSLRWLIRWGAMLIAGTGLWLRLQTIAGLHLGIALDVAIASALFLLVLTARAPALTPPAE